MSHAYNVLILIVGLQLLYSYSILPAISLEGVMYLDIISRSWNAEQFENYVQGLLMVMQPYPMPNSVLVMDNAIIHHFDGIRDLVEAQ